MSTITLTFDNATNYTYNSNSIEVTGSQGKLKLQQGDVTFTEDFADDTGHVYDSVLAEFKDGGVEQKSQIPTNATFGCNYDSKDGNWGDGVLTGTLQGGATVSGSQLHCGVSTLDGVTYDCVNNADFVNQGCIRFKITPNYNGAPVSNSILFHFSSPTLAGEIYLRHNSSGGNLVLLIRDSGGSFLVNNTIGAWSPTASQEYEFELNIDLIAGATRLFIDGVQSGVTVTTTGNRAATDTLYIGRQSSGNGVDASFDDLIIFDSVQHTTNYTPGYSLPGYKYLETSVVVPEMEHTGDGNIKIFNSLISTETGSPRIILQIGRSGNYLYWTGSMWAISNETYDQANSISIFSTNATSLPVNGEKYGQFKIIFPDSNTSSSISELTANLNVDIGYLTTNPTIYWNNSFRTDQLLSLTENSTVTGSDLIKVIFEKEGIKYYWDGTEWVTSDGTYTQSNTTSEINTTTILAQLTLVGADIFPIFFLHSESGASTPLLSSYSITFSFAGEVPNLTEHIIYGNILNLDSNANTSLDFRVQPKSYLISTNMIVINKPIKINIRDSGYFKVKLYTENTLPTTLIWYFGDKKIKTNFLSGTNKFSDLTIISE